MTSPDQLANYYRLLDTSVDADLQTVESAYFQIRGQLICAGQRQEIEPLKEAYRAIKQHLSVVEADRTASLSPGVRSHETAAIPQASAPSESLATVLSELGLTTKLSIRQKTLHIGVSVQASDEKDRITARIDKALNQINLAENELSNVEIVRIYGLSRGNKTVWKKTIHTPNLQATDEDSDLYSFNNRISNTFIFPAILLFAALLSSIEFIRLLLYGVIIWVHEFGHATVAWLCGYRAIPLPFGWTSTSLEKSLFVYFGVLILFGLLFWTGQKEKRKWPMVLSVVLAALQFWGTWIISDNRYDLLMSFGGVGGEFYLSTLLIVSFYFPLPAHWRWDFYRYPALLGAGFVFLSSAWRWRQIESGLQAIPWGTMLGGSGDAGGDMNRLVSHGWSDQQIIDAYNSLGGACVIVILSVYAYFFLKQRNHLFLYAWWKQKAHR